MLTEFYGFALYIAAFVGSAILLLWAFVPDKYIYEAGIIYYPSKYWAAAIPSFLIVTYFTIFLLHILSSLFLTQSQESIAKCRDSYGKTKRPRGTDEPQKGLPPLADTPIYDINQRLFREE